MHRCAEERNDFIKRNDFRSADNRSRVMKDWTEGEIRWITLEVIGERYRRYRLPDAAAETAMAGSLGRYGQLSPLAVCLREERPEVLDGFKRLAAGRTLPAVTSLQARLVVADEPTAKAIILGLNGIGGRMKELEEAWLQRHKSWVCRRLALLERLSEECREDLRLGLLSPTMARQLTRLPRATRSRSWRPCDVNILRPPRCMGSWIWLWPVPADRRWSSSCTSRGGHCGRHRSIAYRLGTRD